MVEKTNLLGQCPSKNVYNNSINLFKALFYGNRRHVIIIEDDGDDQIFLGNVFIELGFEHQLKFLMIG